MARSSCAGLGGKARLPRASAGNIGSSRTTSIGAPSHASNVALIGDPPRLSASSTSAASARRSRTRDAASPSRGSSRAAASPSSSSQWIHGSRSIAITVHPATAKAIASPPKPAVASSSTPGGEPAALTSGDREAPASRAGSNSTRNAAAGGQSGNRARSRPSTTSRQTPTDDATVCGADATIVAPRDAARAAIALDGSPTKTPRTGSVIATLCGNSARHPSEVSQDPETLRHATAGAALLPCG